MIGYCDVIPLTQTHKHPRLKSYGIIVGVPIPVIMVIISYSIIWWHVRSSDLYLKKYGHDDVKKMIAKREIAVDRLFGFG